jgi:TfoX/Sxy family transcriptional regulator of competence genes
LQRVAQGATLWAAMASMKWVRPSQATIDYFERLAPGAPLETRPMFGMPSRFLHGYMLVGLFANTLILHLSDLDRATCIAAGAKPFKPMGREMKAYVAIRPGTFTDHDLKWWIVRGMRHLATLPPRPTEAKVTRNSKAPPSAKPRARSKAKANTKAKAKTRKAPTVTRARNRATPIATRRLPTKTKRKAANTRAASPKRRPAPKKRGRRG